MSEETANVLANGIIDFAGEVWKLQEASKATETQVLETSEQKALPPSDEIPSR